MGIYIRVYLIIALCCKVKTAAVDKNAVANESGYFDGGLKNDKYRSGNTREYMQKDYVGENQFYNPVLQNHSELMARMGTSDETADQDVYKGRNGSKRLKRSSTGQCDRSLCPWHKEFNEQSNRTPARIAFAVCKSRSCNFRGFNNIPWRLYLGTECDIVEASFLVDEGGVKMEYQKWPVACVCAKRKISGVMATGTSRIQEADVTSNRKEVNALSSSSFSAAYQQGPPYRNAVERQHAILRGITVTSGNRNGQRKRHRHNSRVHKLRTKTWEQVMAQGINNKT